MSEVLISGGKKKQKNCKHHIKIDVRILNKISAVCCFVVVVFIEKVPCACECVCVFVFRNKATAGGSQ